MWNRESTEYELKNRIDGTKAGRVDSIKRFGEDHIGYIKVEQPEKVKLE